MDYERASSEVIRSLRGRRSQTAFSRRLGSRGNVVYSWESGRRWPTAAKALWAAERAGVNLQVSLSRFYRTPPDWLAHTEIATRAGVARLLEDLRGHTPIQDVARRTKRSRFRVARWLRGTAEPRLPDFLRMIEATSLRVLDFIAVLVDPSQMPSLADTWRELQTARRAAYEMPWSHAVLRAIELERYAALGAHRPGWIASRLGIEREEETRCIDMLLRTGQIRRSAGRLAPGSALTVDTRQDPEAGRKLKAWWARVALERLQAGDDGFYSYNLFTVSEADYQRLRELHLAYFRELRSIVAQSSPAERVVLANVQLLGLDRGGAVAGGE